MKPEMNKRGMCNVLTTFFVKYKVFSSEAEVRKMYGKKWRNSPTILNHHMEKAKAFLGTFVYFTYHTSQLVQIQALWRGYVTRKKTGVHPEFISRNVYMKKRLPQIKKLQRWIRHRLWKRSIVVPPEDFRKRFLVNEDKMCKIQRSVRKYLQYRASRSLACPYSFQEPHEIPKPYRIVYKDVSTGKPHWRYYDLRCLCNDFNIQMDQRHTMREPSTRLDFPDSFMVDATQRIWHMLRLQTQDELTRPNYVGQFQRSCFYSYLLGMMHILSISRYFRKIEDVKCPSWLIVRNKEKIQQLYMRLTPILYRLARNCALYDLEEMIMLHCQRFLSVRMVMSENNENELAGDMMLLLLKVLVETSKHPAISEVFKMRIRENIRDIWEKN